MIRPRVILRRVLVLLLSVAASALTAEAALRLLGIEPIPDVIGPRHLFVADPVLGIRLRPGFHGTHRHPEFKVSIRIDSLGFRDREIGPKEPGVFRILSLGDSFAYGYGVEPEQTYARLLEGELGHRSAGKRFEVINAGAPSYGTKHMVELLRRHAAALEPDLVLVSFLPANDLADNLSAGFTERNGIVLTPAGAQMVDGSARLRFAVNWSDLALLLEYRWLMYQARRDHPEIPQQVPLDSEEAAESAPGIDVLRRGTSAEAEKQWAAAAEALRDLAKIAKEAGARVAVVHIPMDFQVDPEAWNRVAKRHGLRLEDHDFDVAARRLREACAGPAIPVIDLLETFRSRTASPPLYFRINKHFSVEGHRAAAAAIGEFLEKNGLLR